MRTTWKIPAVEREQIAREVVILSLRQVAERHQISHGSVRNIAKAAGISSRSRGAMKMHPGVPYVRALKGAGWPLRPRRPLPVDWAL